MANTIDTGTGLEVYITVIYRLSDEYISDVLDIDIDETKTAENKKMIAENFNDMILYISDRIDKPSHDDIESLDCIFEVYKRLCVRYGVLPTLETFSDLVGIHNSTFTDWMNGEYRRDSSHGKTVKKWKMECRGKLIDSLHQQSGTNANRIFIAKAAYGLVETAPRQIEVSNSQIPKISQEEIRQIANQAEPIDILLSELPDE